MEVHVEKGVQSDVVVEMEGTVGKQRDEERDDVEILVPSARKSW